LANTVQGGGFLLRIVTPTAGIVSREGVVFLLRVTVVVFVAGAAAGKQQGFGKFPPADSVVTDKLGTSAAVELKDIEYTRLVCGLKFWSWAKGVA
jgi:hypothetical protein